MQAPISIPSILFGLVLACVTYFYGVDSRFAPKNGDEYPYTHIVRMTNAADAWLPLQSEMVFLIPTISDCNGNHASAALVIRTI
ncbi:MAG: hypothetical protein EBV00_04100, partial [Burkholderiaceae bacterium]|nr:hypothetical protein [Burkholderiaceae bacterium]